MGSMVQDPPALGETLPRQPGCSRRASGIPQLCPGTICQLNRAFSSQQLGFRGAESISSMSGGFSHALGAMTQDPQIRSVKSRRESPH